jgi:hypothetical protein
MCTCVGRASQERDSTHRYVVKVSFLEIHNEDLHDLLRDEKSAAELDPPMIREGAGGNIYVAGIVEREVNSYDEMLRFVGRNEWWVCKR